MYFYKILSVHFRYEGGFLLSAIVKYSTERFSTEEKALDVEVGHMVWILHDFLQGSLLIPFQFHILLSYTQNFTKILFLAPILCQSSSALAFIQFERQFSLQFSCFFSQEFFKQHSAPAAERTIQQSIETIRLNKNQLQRDRDNIHTFLQQR